MKRSPLIILFITVVIDLLGFGIILPLLPVYVTKFGGSPVIAGWLTTSFSVMQFVFAPIWGRASDLYGRRPLILLSLLGSAIAFFIFGMAGSLLVLFIARIGGGILTAASLPTAQAYIADVTPPEKRARGMAMIGVAFGIGFALGPWIGAVLGARDLSTPAFFVAGLSFANFVFAFFALPETHTTGRDTTHARKIQLLDLSRFGKAFRNAELGGLLTVFSIQNFAFALLESTFTWLILLRFLHLSPTGGGLTNDLERQAAPMVGPVFGIVGLTIMLVQGSMMSGLTHRIGEVRLIRVGALVLAGSMFWIGLVATLGWLKVAAVFIAVGSGILNPSLSSMISQVADPKERGGVMGVQQGLGSFARIIAPPLGTWLLQRFSTGTPYFLASGLTGIAFLLSLGLKPVQHPDAPAEPILH
jgi:DHA1 family tetracycline resistance protein-like MFS transporter